jgi:hypothetical protein
MKVVNDIYRVDLISFYPPQAGVNTFFIRSIAQTGQAANRVQIAQAFDVAWRTRQAGIMGTSAYFYGVRVVKVRPVGQEIAYVFHQVNTPGTAGVGMMPPGTSGLVSLRAELPKRHTYCRKYIPFPSVVHNTSAGVPAAVYTDYLRAEHATSFINTQLVVDAAVNEEFEYGHLWVEGPGPVYTDHWGRFFGFVLPQKWATQRRRSDFGRPNPQP